MNNKIILITVAVIAVVVIAAGGFFFLNSNKTSSPKGVAQPTMTQEETTPTIELTASEAAMNEVRVELTSSGFSPKDITIDKGTKVVWTNNSGQAATVNSAPHPVHTSYPPLNLGSFNDGQSVELVFDETGTYKYHNHFNSGQTGSVTVK